MAFKSNTATRLSSWLSGLALFTATGCGASKAIDAPKEDRTKIKVEDAQEDEGDDEADDAGPIDTGDATVTALPSPKGMAVESKIAHLQVNLDSDPNAQLLCYTKTDRWLCSNSNGKSLWARPGAGLAQVLERLEPCEAYVERKSYSKEFCDREGDPSFVSPLSAVWEKVCVIGDSQSTLSRSCGRISSGVMTYDVTRSVRDPKGRAKFQYWPGLTCDQLTSGSVKGACPELKWTTWIGETIGRR